MPTVAGMRRRGGLTAAALRDFAERIGVAKNNSLVDIGKLEFSIRNDLEQRAPRALAVIDPLPVTVTNWPAGKTETISIPWWPTEPERGGSREVPFSGELLIEREDFTLEPPAGWKRLAPGGEVRLMGAYVIRCDEVLRGSDGAITGLRCTYDAASRRRPGTGRSQGGRYAALGRRARLGGRARASVRSPLHRRAAGRGRRLPPAPERGVAARGDRARASSRRWRRPRAGRTTSSSARGTSSSTRSTRGRARRCSTAPSVSRTPGASRPRRRTSVATGARRRPRARTPRRRGAHGRARARRCARRIRSWRRASRRSPVSASAPTRRTRWPATPVSRPTSRRQWRRAAAHAKAVAKWLLNEVAGRVQGASWKDAAAGAGGARAGRRRRGGRHRHDVGGEDAPGEAGRRRRRCRRRAEDARRGEGAGARMGSTSPSGACSRRWPWRSGGIAPARPSCSRCLLGAVMRETKGAADAAAVKAALTKALQA